MKVFIWEIWKGDKRTFLRVMCGNVLLSLLNGVSIVLLVPLLNIIKIGSSAVLPPVIESLPYAQKVAAVLAVYVALAAAKAILGRQFDIYLNNYIEDVEMDLRSRLYGALSGASWETLAAARNTDTISQFMYQSGKIGYGIAETIETLSGIASACIQLVIALSMNVPMTLIVCLLGSCLLVLFNPLRKKSQDYGDEMVRINQDFYAQLDDQLASVKEVRAYGVEKESAAQFQKINASYKTANMRFTRLNTVPGVVYSITAAVLIAGTYMVSALVLRVEIDRLVVLVYIFARLWPLFSRFQNSMQYIQSCVPAYEKLMEACSAMQGNEPATESESPEDFSRWNLAAFDQVSFAYHDARTEVLQGVSLEIRRGEITALLGRNGAGKTTIVNLLLGFLMPSAGRIVVDGTPLTNENIRAWRRQAGYIPQDPLILNSSVRENIRRFHPLATDEEIIEALKSAAAWDFVKRLPQGLDTSLGDRGIRLSGGERQRIVLARVLLGNPSIIILDEATNSLDYEGEDAFCELLKTLCENAAVVLIAHRLTTVRMANQAIVLDGGRVAEQGTLDDLMGRKEGYLTRMLSVE